MSQEDLSDFSPATFSVAHPSTALPNLPPHSFCLRLSTNSHIFISGNEPGKLFGEHVIPCFAEIKQNTTSMSERLNISSILGA